MIYSPNNRNKNISNKISDKNKDKYKKHNILNYKKYSPNHSNNNLNLITTNNTNSTKNSNKKDSFNKEKELEFNSVPIKPINELENNIENMFIKKKKKIFKSPSIINKKIITFQRQKDKEILEFFLFDDNLIFKHINKAYLQDEHSDDGDSSSEEEIINGKIYLSQELEQSINDFRKNLKNNQQKQILSRKMKFKSEQKKE